MEIEKQRVYDMFVEIEPRFVHCIGDKVIWIEEPRTDLNWFVIALSNDEYFNGNREVWILARSGADLSGLVFNVPTSIIPTGKESIADAIENFKTYIFDIYTKNKKE